ncbi:MAG: aminoglycoside phosphotransferase family protein [Bacteroidota bacterium]
MVSEASFKSIIKAYFPTEDRFKVKPLGDGNINDTYRLELGSNGFLLQKINQSIFKEPQIVLENYQLIFQHLEVHLKDLLLPALIKTNNGQLAYRNELGQYWRVLTFLEHTYGLESASDIQQVAAAADATGRFLAALNQNPTPNLGTPLPDFHNFQQRYQSFLEALAKAKTARKKAASEAINFLMEWAPKIPNYHQLDLPQRLVHNDPKIGNLLFNQQAQVVAVIDWDTIMPGTLLTDFGDMVRTMVATAGEDEADLDLVKINIDYFTALCQYFLPPLKPLLSALERQYWLSGAFYIVLEQMLRFLQDYLQEDIYYKIAYPEHNLVRAKNQQALFQNLKHQEAHLLRILKEVL